MVALYAGNRTHATADKIPAPRRRIIQRAHRLHAIETPLELVRRDTLPEHADYRDTGCEIAPSCLRCPLARCQYDEPQSQRRRLIAAARDREIVLLRERYGVTVRRLADTYGLAMRTVFRILSDARTGTEVGGGKPEVRREIKKTSDGRQALKGRITRAG
jgi:hypothetical protein